MTSGGANRKQGMEAKARRRGGREPSTRDSGRTGFARSLACWLLIVLAAVPAGWAQQPRFRVLAFWSEHTEPDHVAFGKGAVEYLGALAKKDHFDLETTTSFADMKLATLRQYQLVLWLNDLPPKPEERAAFSEYMESGGGWLGFHIAGYNDDSTNWPWFVRFLGGAVFASNSWPALPAMLRVEDSTSPVTRGLPETFVSPPNEWYIWNPDPRRNPDVRVLVSLDASSYPLGWKDTLTGGDLPVVWTNTRYRMLYINMGHGDQIFTSPVQNRLFENAILWLGAQTPKDTSPATTKNILQPTNPASGRTVRSGPEKAAQGGTQ